jgi:hypothetical protein
MTSQTLPWRDAVLSGFRLLARRPVAAVFWVLLCTFESFVVRGIQLVFAQGVAAGRSLPVLALTTSTAGAVIGLLVFAVVAAAVMRAVIRPDDRAAAWPRFGGDELRLLVLAIPVQLVGVVLGGALIGLTITYLNTDPRQISAPSISVVILVLAVLGARLVLALPRAIARRRLTLRESVVLTRGRYLQLAGLLATVGVMAMLIDLFGHFARDLMANLLHADRPPGLLGSSSLPEALEAAFALGQLPIRLLSGVTHALTTVIQIAPLAYVYRRLADTSSDQAAVFD